MSSQSRGRGSWYRGVLVRYVGVLHREEKMVELEREGVEWRKEWKDEMWQSQLKGFPVSRMIELRMLLTMKTYLQDLSPEYFQGQQKHLPQHK